MNNTDTITKDHYALGNSIRDAIIKDACLHGYKWKSDSYSAKYLADTAEKIRIQRRSYDSKHPRKINCPYCSALMWTGSTMCNDCFHKKIENRKLSYNGKEKPSREELKALVRNNTFPAIGDMYGIGENSVRKWCKKYKLPFSRKEIKKYTDAEWNLI
jgi:hypothetical protein